MDDIRQERSNKISTLNLNKKFTETSLNKKFDTHVKESIAFQPLKK